MKLHNAKVILTGATGGIGKELTRQLAESGAQLFLAGRDRPALAALCASYGAQSFCVDLQDPQSCERLIQNGRDRLGGIDLLINNAAEAAFCSFQTQSAEQLRRMVEINLLTPMLLARAAIPHLQAGGRIVNIGSVFGSIGFPYHAAYSATKFGLRGFSEALRRELRDGGIGVTYVAPRATQTRMNSAAMHRYAERVRMKFDAPEDVAAQILNAVEREKSECVLGQPEGFFVKLNALLPGLVNLALRDQAYAARVVLEQTTTDVPMELSGLNKS